MNTLFFLILFLGLNSTNLLALTSTDSRKVVNFLNTFDQEFCRVNLEQDQKQEVHFVLARQNLMAINSLQHQESIATTGGNSGNHMSGDKIYLGCSKNITVLDYLGSQEALNKFNTYAKNIKNSFPLVDLIKDLAETKLCIMQDSLEQNSKLIGDSSLKTANWLPERINGMDLIQFNTFHKSYKTNNTNEKIEILIKELLQNYIPSYYPKTLSKKAKAVFSIVSKRAFGNKISDEQAQILITDSKTGFPSTRIDDKLKLQTVISQLQEKLKGHSNYHISEDKLYLGCSKNITIQEYLGSSEAQNKLRAYAKTINNIFPSLNLIKDLSKTRLCISQERLEKNSNFTEGSALRSAKWLPERINGMDLIQLSPFHKSFKTDNTNEKLEILIKELLHNYIPGYYPRTLEDKAKEVFSIISDRIIDQKISINQARTRIAESGTEFPSSKVDDRLKMQREISRLQEKLKMIERDKK